MRAEEIAFLLPEVMRRTVVPRSPMAALLAIMEDMHAPSERVLDDLPSVFDPMRTPDRFVPMLAQWVDLQRLDEGAGARIETARMRLLVAMAARIGRRRGTQRGLLEVLTIATGLGGFAIDDQVATTLPSGNPGPPRPFHVRITVPPEGAALMDLIKVIVEEEKPAHLTAEVVLGRATYPGTADPVGSGTG